MAAVVAEAEERAELPEVAQPLACPAAGVRLKEPTIGLVDLVAAVRSLRLCPAAFVRTAYWNWKTPVSRG